MHNDSTKILEDLISNYSLLHPNKIYVVFDLHLKSIAASKPARDYFSYLYKTNDLVGKYINELPISDKRLKILVEHMSLCLNSQEQISLVSMRFGRLDGYDTVLLKLNSILENNKSIGILLEIERITLPIFFSTHKMIKLIQEKYNDDSLKLKFKKDNILSVREHEILFLLFFVRSYDEIVVIINLAHNLDLTPSAISKIVHRNLYTKFDVYNLEALKSKAEALEYHKRIPMSLFGEFIYLVQNF